MANLTDYHYAITGVKLNPDRKHIAELEIRKVNTHQLHSGGQPLGPVHALPRALVISNILSPSNPTSYVTATRSAAGRWQVGAPVLVIRVNGGQYLKTAADNSERDNLGNLPEF